MKSKTKTGMKTMRGNVNNDIAKKASRNYRSLFTKNQKYKFLTRLRQFFPFSIIGYTAVSVMAISMLSVTSAVALSSLEAAQLQKLDPQTRIEQRCDIEAMNRLGRESHWRPDKVLAYAFSDPVMSKHTVKAKGAAFRSGGNWYRLSYICKTQDDILTIKSFEYITGDLIPRSDWEQHYLVP